MEAAPKAKAKSTDSRRINVAITFEFELCSTVRRPTRLLFSSLAASELGLPSPSRVSLIALLHSYEHFPYLQTIGVRYCVLGYYFVRDVWVSCLVSSA